MKSQLTRRSFFKIGMGAVGTLAAGQTLAQVCQPESAEQPLGPFFPRPQTPEMSVIEDTQPITPIYLANDSDLTVVKGVAGKATGQVVYVRGVISNDQCQLIEGATIVIWQASESGRYNHLGDDANQDFLHPQTGEVIKRRLDKAFQYWGKAITNSKGEYEFKTILPGFYPADLSAKWYRPPHIHFMVAARGYPQFVTQMYFSGEKIQDNVWIQELNKKDLLLQTNTIDDSQRKELVVEFKDDPTGSIKDGLLGHFDIRIKR